VYAATLTPRHKEPAVQAILDALHDAARATTEANRTTEHGDA
jgi:hypothetical protein